tara:strand:+ start:208 stop:1179 length:972 start_codon:yes stop_codon:yes gene_type:complete
VPAQFPFALPQIPTFREITRTQGVDQYKLNYHDYCHGDGSATQVTADSLDALGIDVRKDDPLMPNAAILRSAEAVDSILNAASSGSPDVPNTMNAGRILCSSNADKTLTPFFSSLCPPRPPLFVPRVCAVCQLGGLIYFTLLGIIVLVLINFLPLINFIFTLLFDGCVTCIDLTTTVEGRKKVRAGVSMARAAARTAAQNAKQARQGGGGGGGSSGVKVGASGDDPGAFDANNVHLTAQQVRSLKRARRAQRAEMRSAAGMSTTDASWTQRLRRLGARIVHLGDPPAPLQEGRSLLKSQADTVSPPASPPPSSPRGPPQETWA